MAVTREDIRLSEDNLEHLNKELESDSVKAVEYKGNFNQLHDVFWRHYLAKPDQEVKEFPWLHACNYVAPMITVAVDTLSSLYYDAMLSGRPRVIGIDDPTFTHEDAELLDKYFFGDLWRRQISLEHFGNDWNFNTLIDGTSAVSAYWANSRHILRKEDYVEKPITRKVETTMFGVRAEGIERIPVGVKVDVRERAELTFENRPAVEIHDMERVFLAPGTRSSLVPGGGFQYPNCPWYYVERVLSEQSLIALAHDGHEMLKDEEVRKNILGEQDLTEREQTQHQDETIAELSGPGALQRIYYRRLVLPCEYYDHKGEKQTQQYNDPNGIPEEVIIWYWPAVKQISRIVPLSRHHPDNKRPHIDNRYTRLGQFFFGLGVPAKLLQTNKLYTSALRQMVDYGTLQNKPWAFYEPATMGVLPSIQSLQPGAMVPVANARGVFTPHFQGNHQFWTTLENVAQQWMERLTAVTDFTVGRSSQMPNAPRTARGQSMMLQQANIAFSHMVALMAVSYLELFRSVHTLHRRHAPPELEFDYYDRSTGLITSKTVPRRLFRAGIDFHFELNPNRQQQLQNAQNRLALLQNIPYLAQDPEVLRAAMSDVWAADGKLDDFNKRIWPKEKLQVQMQQGMQQPGMQQMPQPGMPQPGMQPDGMQPLQFPAPVEYQPADVEEEPSDLNVQLG